MKLRGKIIGLACLAALIPTLFLTLLVFWQEHSAADELTQKLKTFSSRIIGTSAKNVYDSCEITNELLRQNVMTSMDFARHLADRLGGISFKKNTQKWEVKHPHTGEKKTLHLPQLHLGDQPIEPIFDFQQTTPFIDDVLQKTQATTAIFQRINPEGDMLQVATNLPNGRGQRSTSHYLPATKESDTRNAVIEQVLQGKDYIGPDFILGVPHLTYYTPIQNEKGNITGMLYVGFSLDAIPSLRENIESMVVGQTGHITILRSDPKGRGKVVMSFQGELDGQNVLHLQDTQGNSYFLEAIEKAVSLPKDEIGNLFYQQPDPKGGPPMDMILSYAYFPLWNWVICAQAPVTDFGRTREEVISILDQLLLQSLLGGSLGLICATGLALFLGGRIARPIADLTTVAHRVAEGDLEGAQQYVSQSCSACCLEKEVTAQPSFQNTSSPSSFFKFWGTHDETGQLISVFSKMIRNLNSLVGKVKNSSVDLISTATEISTTAKQQEANVQKFSTSTNEIVSAVTQIQTTSKELLTTMDEVSTVANETADMAEQGRSKLNHMTGAIERLSQAANSISSKLSAINEKAGNIGIVVTTIGKVADETNLLSLNAAIEAEKAGEYGSGFGVVAREIRRLADQTAEATLDIEDMVKEMHSAVSSGVMEMDKFTEEVRRSVEETSKISSQFGSIIEQVQQLTPRFETVLQGMQSQDQEAAQINEAMQNLSDMAEQSSDSLREFNQASVSLRDALGSLQSEVSNFRMISPSKTKNKRIGDSNLGANQKKKD